jgi:hypothetical protein
MIQRLDHHHGGALAHDESVTIAIERTRRPHRLLAEAGRQRASRREAPEADLVERRFGAAGEDDIRLAGPDHAHRIADRLHTRGTGRHGTAERPAEPVLDRNLAGCQVGQEERNGERRQAPHAARLADSHRLRQAGKSADARGHDGSGPLALLLRFRRPSCFGERLVRGDHRHLDEAVHLPQFLVRHRALGIEAAFRIFGHVLDGPADLGGQLTGDIVAEAAKPGAPADQALPHQFLPTTQWRHNANTGYHHSKRHLTFLSLTGTSRATSLKPFIFRHTC